MPEQDNKLMKILTAIASLFIFSNIFAGTVTLGPQNCGLVKQCIEIPNDAGLDISLYGAPGYPYFFLYVDNVSYVANVPSGTTIDAVSMQSFINPDPTNPALREYTGSFLILSGSFSTYLTCVRSGRGQHCSTHWNFIGGSITQ
jgi:hypothetical protein